MQNELNYQPWIWVELIGFDVHQSDRGAKEYLQRLGFKPPAISLLITSPDIIHYHEGLAEKVDFPGDYCSYHGHPRNGERERQPWSNFDLKELIDALHAHGVKVYLATFTFFLNDSHATEWVSGHRELIEIRKDASRVDALMPLKRFSNGDYYEDFLTPKLVAVISDYEFDGWHAADGWGPARFPIYLSDASDDMFEQFVETQKIEVPPHISPKCDGVTASIRERADWVWKVHRRQYIDFYTDRWATFHRKQASALAAIGKDVVINSAWTRDPFEAIYRYGVDYRKIIDAGVKGIVTESAAGASDMEADGGFRLFNYTASLMLTKAYVPEADILFLNGVKDTKEQWDLIHHAPTVYEREILTLSNIFFRNSSGYERCADGFVVCLGDGIKQDEWRWVKKHWDLAFGRSPRQIAPTVIWSDEALQNEVDHFVANRFPTTHYLMYELLQRNAQLSAVTRIENLSNVTGPIVVFNSHLFPEQQLQAVQAYTNGKIILIGMDDDQQFQIRVLSNLDKTLPVVRNITIHRKLSDLENVAESICFLERLPAQTIAEADLNCMAEIIRDAAQLPAVVGNPNNIQLMAMKVAPNQWRLIVHNDLLAYAKPEIDMHCPVEKVDVLSEFPSTIIDLRESRFIVKAPGRGAVALDVFTKTSSDECGEG